jgi:XTP/dITP diphosphohydrolase
VTALRRGHDGRAAVTSEGAREARAAAPALLLATRNEHKRRELARILTSFQLDLLGAEVELPPETGSTFAENALIKARAAARACSRAALGEDSGIEAAALGGAPGIRSARYASETDGNASDAANLAKLRREAPAGSPLRYVCALAYVDPHAGVEELFTGECTGTLAAEPRGEGGFGYDPAFVPDAREAPAGLTMAELADAQKDAISHRGNAARALRAWLEARTAAAAPGRQRAPAGEPRRAGSGS